MRSGRLSGTALGIIPARPEHRPKMDWLTERPVAHRGLHGDSVPENSLGAVAAAVDAGYPVECDVRLSRDGVPMVVHDETLERLAGRDAAVSDLTADELADVTLLGTDARIPRLTEVVQTVDGAVGLLIEVKSVGWPGDLEPAVAMTLDSYEGYFALQSFDPLSLAWFRWYRPGWLRCQLGGRIGPTAGAVQRSVARNLRGIWLSDPHCIGYRSNGLDSDAVARERERGRPILAWTVRSPAEREAIGSRADNVIFENFLPTGD